MASISQDGKWLWVVDGSNTTSGIGYVWRYDITNNIWYQYTSLGDNFSGVSIHPLNANWVALNTGGGLEWTQNGATATASSVTWTGGSITWAGGTPQWQPKLNTGANGFGCAVATEDPLITNTPYQLVMSAIQGVWYGSVPVSGSAITLTNFSQGSEQLVAWSGISPPGSGGAFIGSAEDLGLITLPSPGISYPTGVSSPTAGGGAATGYAVFNLDEGRRLAFAAADGAVCVGICNGESPDNNSGFSTNYGVSFRPFHTWWGGTLAQSNFIDNGGGLIRVTLPGDADAITSLSNWANGSGSIVRLVARGNQFLSQTVVQYFPVININVGGNYFDLEFSTSGDISIFDSRAIMLYVDGCPLTDEVFWYGSQPGTQLDNVIDTWGQTITGLTRTNGGSGYGDGTYTNVPLTNISSGGSRGTATLVVSGGAVTSVSAINFGGQAYAVNDTLSASNANLGGSGSGLVLTVASVDARIYVKLGRGTSPMGGIMKLSNVGGTTEANGLWTPQQVSFDGTSTNWVGVLPGSTWANAFTSGGDVNSVAGSAGSIAVDASGTTILYQPAGASPWYSSDFETWSKVTCPGMSNTAIVNSVSYNAGTTTATATLNAPHGGLAIGSVVSLGNPYNTNVTVAAQSTNTFSWTSASNPGTSGTTIGTWGSNDGNFNYSLICADQDHNDTFYILSLGFGQVYKVVGGIATLYTTASLGNQTHAQLKTYPRGTGKSGQLLYSSGCQSGVVFGTAGNPLAYFDGSSWSNVANTTMSSAVDTGPPAPGSSWPTIAWLGFYNEIWGPWCSTQGPTGPWNLIGGTSYPNGTDNFINFQNGNHDIICSQDYWNRYFIALEGSSFVWYNGKG